MNNIDWRRTGKEVWKMVYEYLDVFEKMVIWKYFGLVKPVLPILDLKKIEMQVEDYEKTIRDSRKKVIDQEMKEHGCSEFDVIFHYESVPSDYQMDFTVKQYRDMIIEKALEGKEKLYVPLPGDMRAICSLLYRELKLKLSLQCPKCKNYNSVFFYKDDKFNGKVFKMLRESFPQRCSIIYKDYLCPCRVVNKENVRVIVQVTCLFDTILRGFYRG